MIAPLTDTELAELRAAEEARAITSARLRRWLEPNLLNDTLNVAIHEAIDALKKDRATIDRLLSDLAHEREARREGERRLKEAISLLKPLKDEDGHILGLADLEDWHIRRDAFLASASSKPGGTEKPERRGDADEAQDADGSTPRTRSREASEISGATNPRSGDFFEEWTARITIPPASSLGQAPIPSEAAVEALVAWLRRDAEGHSKAARLLAEAKSQRNRAAAGKPPSDVSDYMWPTPEQTRQWQAADALEALSRRAPAGEAAQGWQIVPIEANGAMRNAGLDSLIDAYEKAPNWNEAKDVVENFDAAAVYAAMLSSAPQPPKPEVK